MLATSILLKFSVTTCLPGRAPHRLTRRSTFQTTFVVTRNVSDLSRAPEVFEYTSVLSKSAAHGTLIYAVKKLPLRWDRTMDTPKSNQSNPAILHPLAQVHPPALGAPSNFLGPPLEQGTMAICSIRQQSHFLGLQNAALVVPTHHSNPQLLTKSRATTI